MLNIIRARLQQKHRTIKYPDAAPPEMPEKFAGRPVVVGRCPDGCRACQEVCPTQAITGGPPGPVVDTGRCLFCSSCVSICGGKAIAFSRDHRLAAASRESLVIRPGSPLPADALCETARKYFKRSFRLRQVSAGGCNACEADCNVLGTPVWDMDVSASSSWPHRAMPTGSW